MTESLSLTRRHLLQLSGAGAAFPLFHIGRPALAAAGDLAEQVTAAKELVTKAAATNIPWDGPTTGPKALRGKVVVLISEDQRNGGALGVSEGVTEAAKVIGWKLTVLDGAGVIANRSAAFGQAIALKPDVIIADNDDATEQKVNIVKAVSAGIKVLGWHSNVKPGPMEGVPLFTNISTDPTVVAKVAAALAIADSKGTAGVVVFTDATEKISVMKSDAMAAFIKECSGCSVLEVIDTPLASVSTRIPQMTQSLHQRFGKKWTHSLAINDGFFDFMAPTFRAAGIQGSGPPVNISGGDGSKAAFERIRGQNYQFATVAEPLRLHGWQLIDEANRALSGQDWSGYVAPTHLVTKDNIGTNGGPNNVYDPNNGYTEVYKKIWGV
ncbi:MAG: substrate-binding domain-containing protein [Bradyrhizobiaceae bacterium]|nr:substrate-binding domain-containing protein [Bradyrhizobiaceae bacterium]